MGTIKHIVKVGEAKAEIKMADTYFKYMNDEEIVKESGMGLEHIKEMRKKYEKQLQMRLIR